MRFFLVILLSWFVALPVCQAAEGMEKVKSSQSVEKTASRLRSLIDQKGLTYFSTVDHAQNAEQAGLSLRPTTVVIFGNPKLGTPLMHCQQTVAIDLPQKMLVWEDENGQTWIGYNSPGYLADRHGIQECQEELAKVAGALKGLATAAGQGE